MRKTLITLSSLLLAASCGSLARAEGDAEAGTKLTARCMGCHGKTGHSTSRMYPSLAGQDAEYLVDAMKAYRDGGRTGRRANIMVPFVRNLSDQDIADIAAFYSQQE
jgi:cytochrome c553